jgi:hypothetical protein
MTTVKRQILAVVAVAAFASAAHATINFEVTGFAGTGATASVAFPYPQTSPTVGTLEFVIENSTGYSNPGLAGSSITDTQATGPQILTTSNNNNDSTTLLPNLVETGLDTGGSAIEQALASALSVPQDQGDGYTFGVRFQGIPTGGSGFATPTTTVVPAPGAAALAAFGLGIVGWVNRRRAR